MSTAQDDLLDDVDVRDYIPDRARLLEIIEDTAVSLGTAGLGAAIGIAVFASRVRGPICTRPGSFYLGCSQLLMTRAHELSKTVALLSGGLILGFGLLSVIRAREGGDR